MKTLASSVLFLVTFLFTLATLAAEAPDITERKKLEGKWVGGVKWPTGKAKGNSGLMVNISELVIKGDKVTSCKDSRGISLGNCESYALNPKAKTFDTVGNTKEKQGTFQGIYRLNGDKLEWCVANPGIARPKDFFTTPQVQFHLVLTRQQ